MVFGLLLLVGGIIKSDVILGALAVSSLLFAGAAMLAVRGLPQQRATA